MNWFKETWWLVKQLFTTTKNKDKVQYKHMDHYPFSGYSAMSWCGYILTKKKESDIKLLLGITKIYIYSRLRIRVVG